MARGQVMVRAASRIGVLIVSTLALLNGHGGAEPPLLLGTYPHADHLDRAIGAVVDVERATRPHGLPITLAGDFVSFQTTVVFALLDQAWRHGYLPFVNVEPVVGGVVLTSQAVAAGAADREIDTWAAAYRSWAMLGAGRVAYVAPMQEMNGPWVAYFGDPTSYRTAFRRVVERVHAAGVPRAAIRWVFAPNGGSPAGHEFERYYPGDDVVDAVGFSGFNQVGCAPDVPWETPHQAALQYLPRMRAMAPGRPLFLTQTGVGPAPEYEREIWAIELLAALRAEQVGVIWFDRTAGPSTGCDFRFTPAAWARVAAALSANACLASAAGLALEGCSRSKPCPARWPF